MSQHFNYIECPQCETIHGSDLISSQILVPKLFSCSWCVAVWAQDCGELRMTLCEQCDWDN